MASILSSSRNPSWSRLWSEHYLVQNGYPVFSSANTSTKSTHRGGAQNLRFQQEKDVTRKNKKQNTQQNKLPRQGEQTHAGC
jgi:hypothetical protein